MIEIGAYSAKTTLPDLLRQVEAGQTFTITKHGKAVADLVPSQLRQSNRVINTINSILLSTKPVIQDKLLRELKDEGRR